MVPVHGRQATLLFHRNGLAARVVGSVLLAAAVIFGTVLAELTLRSESLRCEPPEHGAAACSLLYRWPFLSGYESSLSPVVAVRTRASAARRGGTNVALLIEHEDRTVSQFEGVGALGERAETVALQMRDHLTSGRQATTFLLRQANVAFGIALILVFCVLPLILFPALHARVRVEGGPTPSVQVGRGLLPARRWTFDYGTAPELVIEPRVVGGNTVYVLRIIGAGTAFDLVATSDGEACRALQERVRAAVAG